MSRNEWAVWLLRLPRATGPSDQPGLILIQVDGLSRHQFNKAFRRRRMPFLRRMLRRRQFRLRTLYSGLPSITPAVQAELFYGVRGTVPCFCFRDRDSGRSVRMFDPAATAKVQARMHQAGEGLLHGGSAYCDIFSGGAAEPHFCPAEFGWGRLWRAVHPIRFAVFMLLHVDSAIRVLAMMSLELVVAISDCARGLIARQNLKKELGMVPARVAVGILMRELITIGASIDTARGLPVIHINFLGYDEQSHRRGPDSRFAHWSLRGIDRAIRRVWRASHRSLRRKYQVWVYSDHGQLRTTAYTKVMGKSIQQAVAEVFRTTPAKAEDPAAHQIAEYGRWQWAVREGLAKLFPGRDRGKTNGVTTQRDEIMVTAMGPLGQIYCPPFESAAERDAIARRLVDEARIPLVLAPDGEGEAIAWTQAGQFRLPRDAREVLGPRHPFLKEAARDLVAICHHPDAGELILSGWSRTGRSISFSQETGSHAGPSIDETRAFALVPPDADLPASVKGYLRPSDLREAALVRLGGSRAAKESLRV